MKKAVSLLLAAMMLFALPVACFAAAPAKPEVSIVVNNIKDETMEVAIQVGAGNFKAVGAALEYDATKLQPIRWSTTAAINVPANADPAVGWANAAVIESICPDYLSGKPALAYQSGDKGYLYLGAEAAAARQLTEATQVVTVRFAYLAASSENRFTEAAATVGFVENDTVAFASPVKGNMIYQTEDRASGEYKFYYLKPLTENGGIIGTDPSIPEGDKIPTAPAITPDGEGETANKGEASTEDFVTLTFYDWDNTLLGTRIIAKDTGSLIDPNTVSNRAIYVDGDGNAKYTDAELAAMGVAPVAPQGNVLTGNKDKNGTIITAENKDSYKYAGWVNYTGGYSTPKVPQASPAGMTIEGSGQHLIALTGIDQNLIVKAAYDEENTIGTSALKRRYVVNHSPFVLNGAYIETTITVRRGTETRRSTSDPVLVVKLRPFNLGETQVRVPLGSEDIETYLVRLPNNAADTYSASNGLAYALENKDGEALASNVNVPTSEMVIH